MAVRSSTTIELAIDCDIYVWIINSNSSSKPLAMAWLSAIVPNTDLDSYTNIQSSTMELASYNFIGQQISIYIVGASSLVATTQTNSLVILLLPLQIISAIRRFIFLMPGESGFRWIGPNNKGQPYIDASG